MMKALIFENKVVDLAATEFEVCDSMSWMDAPDGCQVGWELVDGVPQPPAGPSNEERMQSLRERRNYLLSKTDYLALADSTLTDEMRAYRQALRDLPANTADPANPVWPVKPGSEPEAEPEITE
jgi:hypothetical protein